MINIDKIIKRNVSQINHMVKEYKIERDIDQLIKNYDRLYIHEDPKTQRIRLMGIERQYDKVKNIDSEEKVPTRRIQLYVLKKKYYITFEDNEKKELIDKLNFFIVMFKQLKYIYKVQNIEKENMPLYKENGYFYK